MRKDQVDLENGLAHIPDSKSANGVADMPMSEPAKKAFEAQIKATPDSEHLFPPPKPHITTFKKAWAATLKRAGVPHFPLYHLRHTFAARLSAGGVAGHFVTQLLRQGDATVFKRYSQAKLGMMREALAKLDRQANERTKRSGTPAPN